MTAFTWLIEELPQVGLNIDSAALAGDTQGQRAAMRPLLRQSRAPARKQGTDEGIRMALTADIGKFLEIGGVESLSDIPAAQFEAAKAKLLAKKAQMMKVIIGLSRRYLTQIVAQKPLMRAPCCW